MPQRKMEEPVSDPQEELELRLKEVHQLQTQIKFLEDETALLRRRLTNSPRQVKVLEEQLLQSRGDLARAVSQNEKLVEVLRAEREKISALKEEVEKLARPPATSGGVGFLENGSWLAPHGSSTWGSSESDRRPMRSRTERSASPRSRRLTSRARATPWCSTIRPRVESNTSSRSSIPPSRR